uniref:Phage protein n=1 Tax=Pseudomonas phage vB_PaeM_HTN4 TaxID=3236645 RepID=A0AB39AHM1_9VIRU
MALKLSSVHVRIDGPDGKVLSEGRAEFSGTAFWIASQREMQLRHLVGTSFEGALTYLADNGYNVTFSKGEKR